MTWFQSVIQEHVVRNANTSVSADTWPESNQLQYMLTAQAAIGAIGILAGLGCLGFLLYVDLVQKKGPQGARKRRMFRIVVGHVVFKTLSDVPIFVFGIARTPAENWVLCSVFGSVPALFFVVACTLTYVIYLERAKATAALTEPSRFARTLWNICLLVVVSVPGLLILMILTIHGKVFYGSVCIQDHGSRLSSVFAAMDSALSFAFLYLFLEPVQKHLEQLSHAGAADADSTRHLRKTAKRNLFWACVAVFTTMIYMITVTVLVGTATTEEVFYLRCLAWVLMPICGIVNMISTLAITSGVWKPIRRDASNISQRIPKTSRVTSSRQTGT